MANTLIKTIEFDTWPDIIEITEDSAIFCATHLQADTRISRHLVVNILRANLKTRIWFKFVVSDQASLVLDLKMKIATQAQASNSYLKIDVLILSAAAEAIITPALEITESNLQAGHGLTISDFSSAEIDYLQSRGLNSQEAKLMLSNSFLTQPDVKMWP